MSRTSAHATPSHAPGSTRSSANILQRQNTQLPHICVQREAADPAVHPAAPQLVREVVQSPGQPLDPRTRSDMEPRLGHDLSQVRVHTDERAAASAEAVRANAYTAGTHVAFAPGRYAPDTLRGRQLLTHELTHVVQQASGAVEGTSIGGGFSISHPSDASERSAAAAGKQAEKNVDNAPRQQIRGRATPPVADHIQRDSLGLSTGQADTGSGVNRAAALSAYSAAGSALGGLVSAFAAIRSANFAERSAQAAEDPPSAEPTTGGIAVTDADIPEIKGLDLLGPEDKGKEADSTTKTTETGTEDIVRNDEGEPVKEDVSVATETPASKKEKKKTVTTGTPAKRVSTKESTSQVFKPKDDPDQLKTYKVLNISQGEKDSADFYVSIRSNNKDIKDGGTEPPQANGYLGGSYEANASVNFKARPGQHHGEQKAPAQSGAATVRLLIGGTNTPARKSLQSSGIFGGGGPETNDKYQVQRFSAVVQFDANSDVAPIIQRLEPGIGTAGKGDGEKDALVKIHLPGTYLPKARRDEK